MRFGIYLLKLSSLLDEKYLVTNRDVTFLLEEQFTTETYFKRYIRPR